MDNKEKLISDINNIDFEFEASREDKLEFLTINANEAPEKTTRIYMSVMKKVDKYEKEIGEKWMDFTSELVDDFFVLLKSRSKATIRTYLSIIKDYLVFVAPELNRTMMKGFNYTIGLKDNDLDEYVNSRGEEKRYVTTKEFNEFIFNKKGDPQGKAVFILLYYGVKGTGFSDITCLKQKHFDFETGKVTVEDRLLATIPIKYMEVFKQAFSADTFNEYDNDGVSTFEGDICPRVGDGEDYLIRRNIYEPTKHDFEAPPNGALVQRRVMSLTKSINNSHVDGQSIFVSGRIAEILDYHDMEIPNQRQFKLYKEEMGCSIGYNTLITAARIILDKLEKES